MHVKHIVESNTLDFEKRINDWLEANRDLVVIDIKYCESDISFSALIIYKR